MHCTLTPGTCLQTSSAQIDFTMPRDTRLERKAFTKVIGFSDICRAQDAIARNDDTVRAQNKCKATRRTRALLDAQMSELATQRVRCMSS